jgi:hypothetical protein
LKDLNKIKRIAVMGFPHSGTTILRRILGSHSQLFDITNELPLYRLCKDYLKLMKELDEKALAKGKSGWVVKDPVVRSFADIINGIISNLKIVVIVRDGRDVIVSLRRRDVKNLQENMKSWIRSSNIVNSYMNDNIDFYFIKYEDMVKSPAVMFSNLLNWFGLSNEPIWNTYTKVKRSVNKGKILDERPSRLDHADFRTWQTNQPLFDGSGRWKTLATDEELEAFKDEKFSTILYNWGYSE